MSPTANEATREPGGGEKDRKIDLAISNILRTGVVTSSVLVAVGAVIYLTKHENDHPNFQVFHGQPADLANLQGIMQLALSGQGEGIMQIGVISLLLTPIIRVAFSALAFLQRRDWIYVSVSLIVLSVLLFSLAGGGAPAGNG